MSRVSSKGKSGATLDNRSPAGALVDEDIRFRKLIENSYEGITLLDRDFQVIFRSASAERINGWNTNERVKHSMENLVHPEDKQWLNILLSDVLENPGTSKTCSFRSLHFNGNYIWLKCTFANFFNDPDINAIVCNFRDVTENKQSEDLLQQTIKELSAYKFAIDESSIVAITDQQGVIRHVNDNFCRISRYTAQELIGQDHRILNSAYHDEEFVRNLWGTIAQGNIWKGEIKNRAKDGSYYWVDVTIVPFLAENGKPYQYAAISSDVTERKMTQEKIIESERFTTTVTDNLPAMIAYWDANLYCLFANKPYWEWFEKKPGEILGINKRDLLDKNEFEVHESHIKQVLKGEPQSFERTFRKADGTKIYTQTQYLPDTQNGVVKGFYSLIYDYTKVVVAEAEVKKTTEQIEDLLENINDGFIALDENLCYTYANKRIGEMLGQPPKALVGKNIWELFPDAVGSATYDAVTTALREKTYVCNEDCYQPLNLWQENRVYPAGSGVSMFIRDITKIKQEEYYLKLLESVITNTTDAVLITQAELDEPGPRIVYVNQAFTVMTGYTAAEVMDKTPRLLQGPKSDKQELKLLSEALRKGMPHETSIINYRKNGEEFWVNFSVSPVSDVNGKLTHFIAIERDVTQRKNEELLKLLLADISLLFNEPLLLDQTLRRVLERLVDFGNFSIAEAWLIDPDKSKINLAAKFFDTSAIREFYNESTGIRSLSIGEGLPGITWQTQTIQFWPEIHQNEKFIRREAAKNAGLKTLYGLPLNYNNETIGVLVLGLNHHQEKNTFTNLFEAFSTRFGTEIRRKQLEQELNQVFHFTPDILCIASTDGYFKKVNPAMCALLEYDENELLSMPFMRLVHPLDQENGALEMQNIIDDKPNFYLENRYITKSGKVRWLAWTTTAASAEGLIYCSAKDITDKKELEELVKKATTLARIGSWEADLAKGTVFWSDITKEIYEVDAGIEPTIDLGLNFYRDGDDRDTITKMVETAIMEGEPFDAELQIITGKGRAKWVRVIGEADFIDGMCIRLTGSLQDINERKIAEIASVQALKERNIILESIDDAFFAVDKNWVVTYWNNMAENVLGKSRTQVLNQNLWAIYSDSKESDSFRKYQESMETNQVVHFEDYYAPRKKWYEISVYPSDTGLSVYLKDVTDRKESDIQMRELNEMLQKHAKELAISNAELEQFAYVASHDLQEPLRMVTSFMTQLERKYGDVVDDKGRQYIHFAVDGAKRMRQIILDLLDFSRVGRMEDDVEDVNINKLMNEILALYRKQIEDLGADIKIKELPIIQTHKTPLRQVFQNLVGNSLKYHRHGVPPQIRISCTETKAFYQFSVKDNGIGIEAEYFDKIFIIFQRLHNKDEYSGTGMGLAIAKKIIENMGGKIWVESVRGEGSTFYFTILKPKTS